MEKDVQKETQKGTQPDTEQKEQSVVRREIRPLGERADWNIRPYLAIGLIAFLVIVLSIIAFFFIFRYHGLAENWGALMKIFQPIIIGFVIAYLVNPLVKWLEKYTTRWLKGFMKREDKIKKTARGLSVAGALIFFILIIAALLAMVIPQLYTSIERLVVSLPEQADMFVDWISPYLKGDDEVTKNLERVLNQGVDYFEGWAKTELLPQTKNIITQVTSGAISALKALFNFIIGIIISMYVLMGKEIYVAQAKKLVYALFPTDKGNVIITTVRKANDIFGGFIMGKILDSCIIGVLCFIGLSFLKMPYTLLVSVIVGVTNVIPFFGPYIGAVPSAILIILTDPMKGVYFIIFILALQQVDGNIIGPKILGDSTGLNSFWVIFAILVAGGIFGVPGMIFGVPLFATIYYVIQKLTAWVLRKRGLPEETKEYAEVDHIDISTGELHLINHEEKEAKKPKFFKNRKSKKK